MDKKTIVYCPVCGIWHEPGFLAYMDHISRFHKIELHWDAEKSVKEKYLDALKSTMEEPTASGRLK